MYLVLIDTISDQNKAHNEYYANWFQVNIENKKLTDMLDDMLK